MLNKNQIPLFDSLGHDFSFSRERRAVAKTNSAGVISSVIPILSKMTTPDTARKIKENGQAAEFNLAYATAFNSNDIASKTTGDLMQLLNELNMPKNMKVESILAVRAAILKLGGEIATGYHLKIAHLRERSTAYRAIEKILAEEKLGILNLLANDNENPSSIHLGWVRRYNETAYLVKCLDLKATYLKDQILQKTNATKEEAKADKNNYFKLYGEYAFKINYLPQINRSAMFAKRNYHLIKARENGPKGLKDLIKNLETDLLAAIANTKVPPEIKRAIEKSKSRLTKLREDALNLLKDSTLTGLIKTLATKNIMNIFSEAKSMLTQLSITAKNPAAVDFAFDKVSGFLRLKVKEKEEVIRAANPSLLIKINHLLSQADSAKQTKKT